MNEANTSVWVTPQIMKYIVLLFTIISAVGSLVTERTRINERSDVRKVEDDLDMQRVKDGIDKKNESKQFNGTENKVYLDDVMVLLRSLEWSDAERPCLDQIYKMLYGLQNFTLWAVWDWDTQSSEPQGILFGNKYQLGNFDQCLNAPWAESHPELKTKYCLADITLERTDRTVRRRKDGPLYPYQSALDYIEYRPPHSRPLNELIWGTCVPSSCGPRTVEKLLRVMISRSHLGAAGMRAKINITEPCQDYASQREFDSPFYAFMGLMVLLIVSCLVCTYLNCQNDKPTLDTIQTDIIKAFCIKENSKDLLKMKKSGVEVLYGIRYLTMCLIVLDHQIGILNAGPISDGVSLDKDAQSPLGLLVLHDDLFVDTFFMLSGFLMMSNLVTLKKLPNLILIIVKRYVRMVIALALVVFFVSAVFPFMGSGPLWNKAIAHETVPCRKNWWLNLLMVSNYVDTENICIVVSWYIPCDFHFFVVTVFAFYVYKSSRNVGLMLAAVLFIGSLVLPAVVNYTYQLSPVQLFTYEFVSNPRSNHEFHMTYIKSHTRYSAYLVGCVSGCLFVKYSAAGVLEKIKKNWAVLGTCFALLLMLVVMLTGGTFLWRTYHPIEGAVYAALNRPAWACGVALLVLCCAFGKVPLVKSFLCWYPWVPLSRLSYGLYLTHTVLVSRNVFVNRNPQHNDYFEIMNSSAGLIFWGSIGALLLWLFAEAPATKLFAICLQPRSINKSESANEDFKTKANDQPAPSVSTDGHLQDNLPSNIQYSSKV